ncbi:hypothetical protein Droror1_Dr00006846 [Drosera rotundifolia]
MTSISRSSSVSGNSVAVDGATASSFHDCISQISKGDNHDEELIEVELELKDDSIVLRSLAPATDGDNRCSGEDGLGSSSVAARFSRSLSSASNSLRKKLGWPRSASFRSNSESASSFSSPPPVAMSATDALRIRCQLQRTRSSAQRALGGLRFISRTTRAEDDATSLWMQVESRFEALARNGFLCREDFGECIGMGDSREFAEGIFDALARRRRRQRISRITKEELYEFWKQLSDQSFDARLQIFFDMADSNEDGRITREEVQELIMLSASANKLSALKDKADEYANLIMEELDPDNLGYIELWQLETLLLQKDDYMNYSRPLSIASGRAQSLSSPRRKNKVGSISRSLMCLILENWQRGWIILLWAMAMVSLFIWKFIQYRNRETFEVMGYCICIAKGAAETVKLNMALILLPVCRNTLTWLRSTQARLFVPFDDNLNLHKIIARAIVIGIALHAGNHIACDFPRLVRASPEKFACVASDFNNKQPTYSYLYTGIEGLTGITMVILMTISFTLATSRFRRNAVRLPAPFNRLAGYNAFWYSHHLLGLVYLLLLIHGTFLFFVKHWYQKTTWMYISVPLLLYVAERSLRTCRSEFYAVQILKVSELPGHVFSLIMGKPQGFKYKSGQYIFLQCPTISKFEWHPFSITSAPDDNYLSVHIRIVGDWTRELKRVVTEGANPSSVIGRLKFGDLGNINEKCSPRLLIDGPYGAPAQDYRNYDVLLLVGLGIGATPFVSILRDLLNNKRADDSMSSCYPQDSTTEASTLEDSLNSFASPIATQSGKKKSMRVKNVHFCWVTREPGSFEWFKGVMDEVAEMDHKGFIDMHNYLTSVYEESDARSALITMIQALNHAKYGVDILTGTRVKTHFARPNWKEVFARIAKKHPYCTVGVFYCGSATLGKELKKLSRDMTHKSSTRFEFHKEQF